MPEQNHQLQENPAQQPPQPLDKEKKKKPSWILWVVLVVILLLIGGGTYYYFFYKEKQDTGDGADQTAPVGEETTDEEEEEEEQTTYINPTYGYRLQYPSDWELTESEAEDCSDVPEDSGGCDIREEASSVWMKNPESGNSLWIVYSPIGQIQYYDRDENAEEESFTVWGEENIKASVYCNSDGSSLECTGGDAENIAFTEYFSEWLEGNPDGSSCGSMVDDCGDYWSITGMFTSIENEYSSTYSEDDDEIFDQIVSSMTAPECD